MKSKAPLALMEQLVMVLVFALAAALCLQVFVLSDQMSRRGEMRDRAVVQVQNMAETLKSCHGNFAESAQALGGTWDGTCWKIGYDRDWQPAEGDACAYLVRADLLREDAPLLGGAAVSAQAADGEILFGIEVFWQEVAGDA